jgi:uncharacterized membrane protein
MNDLSAPAARPGPHTPEQMASLKNILLVVYALQALSFAFGVTAIVGLVIDYIKRDEAAGTIYQSHFDWQIRTFWWGLVWTVVGIALAIVAVGFVVLFVVWVWAIYRVVKGFLKLNDGLPVHPA